MMTRAEHLASLISNATSYEEVADECTELCELAGMGEELESADGEHFESVLYKAAESMGVCIS